MEKTLQDFVTSWPESPNNIYLIKYGYRNSQGLVTDNRVNYKLMYALSAEIAIEMFHKKMPKNIHHIGTRKLNSTNSARFLDWEEL